MSRQLDIFEPPAEGWWEVGFAYAGCGHGSVSVIADGGDEAQVKAEARLVDLGVHPASDPDLRAAYRRMREYAAGARP